MKQRCLKKTCLLLLVGTLLLVNYPFAGYTVYAQEEPTITQPSDIEETTNTEIEISTEHSIENVNEISDTEVLNITVDTDETIEVPEEAMVVSGGVYYGISKEWYDNNYPNGDVLKVNLIIPSNVTSIYKDALRESWLPEKEKQKVLTDKNYDGDKTSTHKYDVVSIDFSNATSLKEIGSQAAMHSTYLSGVIDLSNTKVETLAKSAFNNCPNITGVILPATLKNIGSTDGGSVFKDCTGLQFVRTAGQNEDAVFELPEGLELIGKHAFNGCKGLPTDTVVHIPASVTYVGSEAFYKSPNITTIVVESDDASNYDGVAFKGESYGLGKRMTVFKNSSAKNSFSPSGSNTYSNSLTYEFTLKYDDVRDEKKLWGQAVNVSKGEDGNWFVDGNYLIPNIPDESIPVGYTAGWIYNDAPLTNKTLLKPSGDELVLNVSYVLSEPTIEFIVDGEAIESDSTYPKLNLSNNEEHTIGVKVSHPIETVEDADVKVKFEYAWTDVWKGGSQGERMEEDGFGRYNLWDNPDVTNTISINGPEHERTNTGNYSGEDYGDGYYLVEIYGYYCPKSGGAWKLFYKSASTVIGSDPERTTNTAYLFDVITSAPVKSPDVTFSGNTVKYGYHNAEIIATVSDIDGQINTYQWYKSTDFDKRSGKEIIPGANSTSLNIEDGKDVGSYNYYLEITSTKESNGDTIKKDYPVTLTVEKAPSTLVIKTLNMDKTYDKLQVSNPLVEKTGSTSPITFTWYIKNGDTYTELATSPSDAGSYKVVARVEEDMNHGSAEAEKTFEILKATPNLPILDVFTIKKGSSLSSISLPTGFTWLDENQIASELGVHSFKATYMPSDSHNYLSVEVDIAVNVVPALVTINHLPTISASDKTITVGDKFDPKKDVTASDIEDGDLTDKIEIVENTLDASKAGSYYITYKVTDTKSAYTLKRIIITVKDKEVPVSPSNPDDGRMEVPNTGVNSKINQNIMIGSMFAILLISAIVSLFYFKHHNSK